LHSLACLSEAAGTASSTVIAAVCLSVCQAAIQCLSGRDRCFPSVIQGVLIRRTKDSRINGEPAVKLPPRELQLLKQEFSGEERDFYTRLHLESKAKLTVRHRTVRAGAAQQLLNVADLINVGVA
jgi:SNF2 family DNA or RNA helicase